MFVLILLSIFFPGLATAVIRQSALPSYYLVDYSSQLVLPPWYTTATAVTTAPAAPFVAYSLVDSNLARILSKPS